MKKHISFRTYRTYLLNLSVRMQNTELAKEAKLADTKELKIWYNCEYMLDEGHTSRY